MTVNTSTARDSYAGNGSTTAFTGNFKIFKKTEVRVVLVVNSTGVETVQVVDSDYTVSGLGADTHTVTMTTAPATGETLILLRNIPLEQQYDYTELGKFPAESHEENLDRIVMMVQQLNEEQQRAIQLAITTTLTDITFPNASAGKAIKWNSAGDDLENSTNNFDDIVTDATAQATAAAASASAASTSATASATSATASAASAAAAASSAASIGEGTLYETYSIAMMT